MRQVILDTETTGLSPAEGHRLTEIGCVELINRKLTGNNFQSYLNPERELDEGAERITGLNFAFLQDKPKFKEIAPALVSYLADADEVIIHNAVFDLGFLNNELALIKHEWQELQQHLQVFDTLILARQLHPGQRNSLDALCKRYKVNNTHREKHGALLDAEILAEVYLAMTAGQTNLMLSHDQEPTQQSQSKNIPTIAATKRAKLTIIKATEAELAEHSNYLQHIKESAGVCVWDAHGTE